MLWWHIMRRAILLIALLAPVLTCGQAPEMGSSAEMLQAATPQLADRAGWQRYTAGSGMLVSPRWQAEVGLVAADQRGRSLRRLDARRAVGEPILPPVAVGPEFGELLYDDGQRQVYHHSFRGRITAVLASGEERVLVRDGPWGVAVSPDGRRIAFSRGSLREPTLYLYEEGRGAYEVGRGAQPAWFPDSRFLAYAVPGPRLRRGGLTVFASSELHLLDAHRGVATPLTSTPDLAELEPAVSPDGTAIAFADWLGGAVWVAPVKREAAP